MTHHPSRAIVHRYALNAFLFATMAMLLPAASVRAEPQPGHLLEIKVDTPGGPATVRFRYCPPGQLLRGKPRPLPKPTGNELLDRLKRKTLLADMKGFYIAETEVSQQQFQRVLGDQAVERIFQRMFAEEKTVGRGSDFPIRGVSIFEAAKFCESVRQLDAQNPVALSGLEDRRFRLPTHDEWQYACRARSAPEQTQEVPHFNVWPNLKDVPKGVLADCEDVWKKLGEQTPFVGTQDQVMRVIEAHDTPIRGVEIFSEFLRLALGTKREGYYSTVENGPELVRSGTPNEWSVYNMHGNVSEWTIAAGNADRLSDTWRMLLNGNGQPPTADDKSSFVLAGGSYNQALDRNASDWIRFSIWGGPYMPDGKPKPYALSDLESQNVVQDFVPGFRVVLERVLADNWVFVIRETTVLNEKATLNDINKQLADHRDVVAELATGSELALARVTIGYYEALASYQKGNRKAGARLLANSGPELAKDDSYFKLLQDLMNSEAK